VKIKKYCLFISIGRVFFPSPGFLGDFRTLNESPGDSGKPLPPGPGYTVTPA